MANTQRLIRDNTRTVETVLLGFPSGVTVELGDLIFLDSANNLRNNGSSTATNLGYPFEYFRLSGASLTLNKFGVKDYFYGIAMDDKDGISNGSNQNLTVGTRGKFYMDLKPNKTVKVMQMYGASGTTAASNLANQKVMKVTDSDYALGYFLERKLYAQSAEINIRNRNRKI